VQPEGDGSGHIGDGQGINRQRIEQRLGRRRHDGVTANHQESAVHLGEQLQAREGSALAQGGLALHLRGGGNPRLLLDVPQLVVSGSLGGQVLPDDLLRGGPGVAGSHQGSPDQAIATRPGDGEPQFSDLGYVFDFHSFASFYFCVLW
jgi:hypothetical protein